MINYIRYFIYKLGLSFEHKFVFLNQRANALPLCHYNISENIAQIVSLLVDFSIH